MSNIVSGIAQRRVVGSSPRKAVLMLMSACASDDGSGIWASKANMASDLEMSRRTVQKAITEMIEMGIVFEAGKRPCLNGYTVEYGINIEVLSALECTRATDAPVRQMHVTRAAGARQDVQQVHPNRPLTIIEPSVGAPSVAKPKSKQSRSCAIPENWVPNDGNISHAISKNFTHEEIQNEADKFRNHHLAKGTRFKNWDAGWRTWIGNAIEYRNRNMAFKAKAGGYGQGGGIAGAAARRQS